MAHLLIVDDDPIAQRSLMRSLPGHTYVAASDGAEGLRILSMETFDLIISDVDMPGVNGIEFYERHIASAKAFVRFVFRTGSNVPRLQDLGVPILPKWWPHKWVTRAVNFHLGVSGVGVSGGNAQSKALCQVGGG